MTITKNWLMTRFKLTEFEADNLKSIGCMLGQTKSLTVSFAEETKGRNRQSFPTPSATVLQIQALQLDIHNYIERDSLSLFETTDEGLDL